MAATPIRSEVSLDADGKQVGFLRVPHSSHRSAYGWIPVPIASIRKGSGPTVLVMAGNHGDEYEGQIIVSRMIRDVEPEMVSGHLILVSMLNFPAADAGLRTSPIDGANLNRCFPGNPTGSPTEVIAHYVEHDLIARAQVVVDLHSGGSSLQYLGANMMALEPRNADEQAQSRDLLTGFGLPRAFFHAPNPVTISSAARRQGAISIVTELGGGGTVIPSILREADQGLRHLLGRLGVLTGKLVPDAPPAVPRLMRIDSGCHYIYAPEGGVFEPLVELGEMVEAGQPVALLHRPHRPSVPPETVRSNSTGLVVCKRTPALTRLGDCLFHLAEDL